MRARARRTGLVVALFVAAAACASPSAIGKLVTPQDLPADVIALTEDTWSSVLAMAPHAAACMTEVELVLVAAVDDGDARYLPGRIEIEIPTSPARFPESLVHELAHHVDATCPTVSTLRPQFATAQSFPDSAVWGRSATWADDPAEHFAEAFVLLVRGERLLHEDIIELRSEAVAVVAAWARQQ